MFKDKGIIFPPNLLGKNVESLMFTREFLKEKNISLEGKEAGFNFIKNYINLPLIRAEQVHGTQIKQVVKRNSESIQGVDGVYTRISNLALSIMTADCMPIILASNNGKEIAAVHAGWRGLCRGVLEESIKHFHSSLDKVTAWIAPCISGEMYEVGEEVVHSFLENDQESVSNIIKARNSKKWFLNLRLEAKRRMENSGIRVLVNDYCTFKDKELFFSYRRNKSKARMITVVWRKNED